VNNEYDSRELVAALVALDEYVGINTVAVDNSGDILRQEVGTIFL
jgi:hypothetical protein